MEDQYQLEGLIGINTWDYLVLQYEMGEGTYM